MRRRPGELNLSERQRSLPPWTLPLLIFVSLLLLVFWGAPQLARRFTPAAEKMIGVQTDSQDRRVIVGELAIFPESGGRSERLSSCLYNEIVSLEGAVDAKGYVRIRTSDGVQGYVRAAELSGDLSPVDPSQAVQKALVLGAEKRLVSDAIAGNPVTWVPMGTILYADYNSHDLLRLRRAFTEICWLSTDRLQLAAPNASFWQGQGSAQLFASSAMNFYEALYRSGGISKRGADMAGVIFIAARVNGLELPRLLEAQARNGETITLADTSDAESRLRPLLSGDVLFFSDKPGSNHIVDAAIVIEKDQVLMHRRNDESIQVYTLKQEEINRICAVRRYFEQD